MDPGVVHQGNHVLEKRKPYILMNDKLLILFKYCPPRQPHPGAEEDLLLLKRSIYDYGNDAEYL